MELTQSLHSSSPLNAGLIFPFLSFFSLYSGPRMDKECWPRNKKRIERKRNGQHYSLVLSLLEGEHKRKNIIMFPHTNSSWPTWMRIAHRFAATSCRPLCGPVPRNKGGENGKVGDLHQEVVMTGQQRIRKIWPEQLLGSPTQGLVRSTSSSPGLAKRKRMIQA